MSSLSIALVVAALIAASGLTGLLLQRVLAEHHTAERSRDMIGGVVGLLTLLLALVLGLLIWTAYGVFNVQQTELQTIAARALEFDLEMRQYGPDGLDPKTDAQKQLLQDARRNYAFIGENRLLMSMQTSTPIAWPLIYAVTAWSCLMFGGMGLLSRVNATTLTMLVLGAGSIGVAFFLILEFNKPYTSDIRVSPVALEQAIIELDKPGAAAAGASQ